MHDDVTSATGSPKNTALKIGRMIFSAACIVAAIGTAAALLHAAWCAYTNSKFALIDYGLYSGALWNTAHGHPFSVLNGETYLNRHLTFSLVLLAPIVWITDHPFLLSFMQWALGVTGVALLVIAARKQNTTWPVAAAIAAFCLLLPLTQGVLLAEVHGVGFMIFALPWLYYVARFKPSLTWLPLIVLCGLREESGIYAAALLFALAWQQRSPRLALYGIASLIYVVIAIKLLFPLCNGGLSLFVRRGNVAHLHPLQLLAWKHMQIRGIPFLRVLLIALPLLLVRPGLFSILCGVPLLVSYFSPLPHQINMELHYAAPMTAALGVFFVMACDGPATTRWHSRLRFIAPAWLLAAAFLLNFQSGFVWPARNVPRPYTFVNRDGLEAIWIARQIPKQGLLLCDGDLSAYCADREAIQEIKNWTNAPALPRFVFSSLADLRHDDHAWVRTALSNGSLQILRFDGDFFVATPGKPDGIEKLLLNLAKGPMQLLALPHAPKGTGKKLFIPGTGYCRDYPGAPAPKLVAGGAITMLSPGDYTALLFMKIGEPAQNAGTIQFLVGENPIATAPLAITNADPVTRFGFQTLQFTVAQTNIVEARITGAAAPLTLNRILIAPSQNFQ